MTKIKDLEIESKEMQVSVGAPCGRAACQLVQHMHAPLLACVHGRLVSALSAAAYLVVYMQRAPVGIGEVPTWAVATTSAKIRPDEMAVGRTVAIAAGA